MWQKNTRALALVVALGVALGLVGYLAPLAPSPQPTTGEVTPVQAYRPTLGVTRADEIDLLARLVAAEAGNEPYTGQVAVAGVVLNRVASPSFPNTIGGVIYQPRAFESVASGYIWRAPNFATARRAAVDALNGWDPGWGSLFFWNPYKPVSAWIWSRPIITQIGRHVFAR